MLEALSTPRNRIVSAIFLLACGVLAAAAAAVGISDNPPGILLAYLAAAALVLAFVHPWRAARKFRLLFYGSLLGLVLFGVAHNVFDAAGAGLAAPGALHTLLQALSVAAFLFAVLLVPPTFLVGVVGWLVFGLRERHRPTPA